MKNRSIRFKLTLWFSLALIVIVGIAEVLFIAANQKAVRENNRAVLSQVADQNSAAATIWLFKSEYVTDSLSDWVKIGTYYLQVRKSFQAYKDDVYTAIYNSEDKKLIYGEDPLYGLSDGALFSGERFYTIEKDGVRYEVMEKPLSAGYPAYSDIWIRGVIADTKGEMQMWKALRTSLILLPILILLAILLSYFLTGKLVAPVKQMEEAAESISKGDDLKRRIDIGDRNDELGNLAGSFNHMLDRLEDSFETERRFTADASHELRTPTSVILAESECMLEKLRWPHEYKQGFETVKKQGERMNSLITDMLDFTRLEQGSERYPFEELDLSELVSETADQMTLLETKGISLKSYVQEGLKISGNRMLLTRLLQNLISNAYRYGKENGHVTVALKSKESAGEGKGGTEQGKDSASKIILSVADDGIGIPKDEQEKIFERFYRCDASRTEQGTGLGLSMVKRIAELHHAKVSVESEEGKGSTFTVVF